MTPWLAVVVALAAGLWIGSGMGYERAVNDWRECGFFWPRRYREVKRGFPARW